MTSPVPVPAAPEVPTFPALGAANFNSEAYAFGAAMPGVSNGLKAIGDATHTNAQSASESATAAQQSALAANQASEAAQGAANFKGVWSSLTGSLTTPATVKHGAKFWLLLQNVADITAHEPAEGQYWTARDGGQVVQTITASAVAVPGVYYVATVPGITLTVPDDWGSGDTIAGRNASGGACFIDWNGHTLLDEETESPMRWPADGRFEATYNGSTFA